MIITWVNLKQARLCLTGNVSGVDPWRTWGEEGRLSGLIHLHSNIKGVFATIVSLIFAGAVQFPLFRVPNHRESRERIIVVGSCSSDVCLVESLAGCDPQHRLQCGETKAGVGFH